MGLEGLALGRERSVELWYSLQERKEGGAVGVEKVVEDEGGDRGDVELKGRRRGKRGVSMDIVQLKPSRRIVRQPEIGETKLLGVP